MKKNLFYCAVMICLGLISCKVDVDNAVKLNKIEFTLKTSDGDALASNAKVFVYESNEAYQADYDNGDTIGKGALSKGVASNGKFLTELSSDKPYWIRVIYFQKSNDAIMNGEQVMYSNDELGVQFGPFSSKNFENNNLTTKATITLTKAYYFLVLTAKDSARVDVSVTYGQNLKCKVLNNESFLLKSNNLTAAQLDDLKNNIATNFNKDSKQYLVVVVPKGKINIFYKSILGCSKAVSKTITGNTRLVVDFIESCQSGLLVFYNKASNTTYNDIKVVLTSPNDTLGTLSSFNTSYVGDVCDFPKSASLIKVSREIGTYHYVATSKIANKEQQGTVSITVDNQCVPIEILLP
jgi:hypothetical protein